MGVVKETNASSPAGEGSMDVVVYGHVETPNELMPVSHETNSHICTRVTR